MNTHLQARTRSPLEMTKWAEARLALFRRSTAASRYPETLPVTPEFTDI